jgi:GT2 family glycosyltransferase
MVAPSVTIVLTRYNEPNWLVWSTLESLSRQEGVKIEVLFADQRDDAETRDHLKALNNEAVNFRYETIPAVSLSYARNFGIKHAQNDLILFIDSDAIAAPDWAKHMAETLQNNNAGIVGGKILPKWHERPLLLARARVVLEQYSMLDLGEGVMPIAKVVGASFGINRAALKDDAYFDERLGRRAGILLGGEETDLCARARMQGLSVFYNGKALVHHQVLPERIRYAWIFKRIYFAGIGRAMRGGAPAPSHKMGFWDFAALPVILPFYFAGLFRGRTVSDAR